MDFAVGETPLHSACIKGDLAAVEALLEQGADINTVDNAGNEMYIHYYIYLVWDYVVHHCVNVVCYIFRMDTTS